MDGALSCTVHGRAFRAGRNFLHEYAASLSSRESNTHGFDHEPYHHENRQPD